MKSIISLMSLAIFILALAFPLAFASDPNPLQDFCVAINDGDIRNGVFINGQFCKDPKLVTIDDFVFSGLNIPGNTSNELGLAVNLADISTLPGLNGLGIGMSRVDIAANGGLNPPHIHPRASEIFLVLEGTLYAGFITSLPEYRLITKVLQKGDAIAFPVGLIHFQLNIGKTNAVAIAGFSTQNPGIIRVADASFGSNPPVDPEVLAKAFRLDKCVVKNLQSNFNGKTNFDLAEKFQHFYNMIPSAGEKKQLNLAKGDRPYDFSPLPQESCVVPINEPHVSSQAEENKNVSSQLPITSSNMFESENTFMEITYYGGLLIFMAIFLYEGYRYIINIDFMYPPPLLETKSFAISNLNISDSNLVGNWDAYFTFGHSMDDYVDVTHYKILVGSIYYKQDNNLHAMNNVLAKANATTFNVRQKEYARVHLKFTNVGFEAEQPGLEDQAIKEISKEAENGVMNFALEILVGAEFQKGGKIWSGLDFNGIRYCWELMAGIDKVTGKGKLIHAKAVFCD
ncbi:Germin [Corchorus capsularis]|uniref:Germin n=1 Tax=Corchorus capsularis TaxID=210143 RepID=A0A1R3IPY4_COCAP|nr:Germin [Corchorus capsularis]